MRLSVSCGCLCGFILLIAGCGQSGTTSQSSPEGLKTLAAASDFYRQQAGIRVESRMEAVVCDTAGNRLEDVDTLVESRIIVVQPENRYMLQGNEFRLASDGKSLRLSRMLRPQDPAQPSGSAVDPQEPAATAQPPVRSTEADVYCRTDAPADPLKLAEVPMVALLGGSSNLRMLCLLDPGLSATLLENGRVVDDRGQETIAGKPVHHLEIRQLLSNSGEPYPVAVTELWVAVEGDPVLLQYKHTTLPQQMRFGRTQIEAVVVVTETFGDWQFGGDEPDSTFVALPGSRRVHDVGQLMQPASPLIGKPAPDLELPLLDGESASLAALKAEQKIVLLDFWATWCGPCLQELPLVARLADELADKGVVLYAVNQGEPAHTIKSFQYERPFKFTAALDESGEISDAFGVRGIPHLCMIGRDGTVQVVHVGIGRDTEIAIREELAALIAGRNLAVDGLPD